jgi:hypothetical protein
MLFTGLAWLGYAVFLIPKVSELGHKYKFLLSRKSLVISQRKGAFSWYYFCNYMVPVRSFG